MGNRKGYPIDQYFDKKPHRSHYWTKKLSMGRFGGLVDKYCRGKE